VAILQKLAAWSHIRDRAGRHVRNRGFVLSVKDDRLQVRILDAQGSPFSDQNERSAVADLSRLAFFRENYSRNGSSDIDRTLTRLSSISGITHRRSQERGALRMVTSERAYDPARAL